ncbi:MAG: hypothetical protein EKK61_04225 [Rickettsiales bacterium]|nr:MAG: hypothetical protein EKK61_04225 [Rickettsiales bacterium]
MLNSFVFNGAEYNFAIPTNTNNIVFSFNGFNFFNDNIWLTAFDDKAPKADILRHRRSYSDGYLFARKTHSDKTITIR